MDHLCHSLSVPSTVSKMKSNHFFPTDWTLVDWTALESHPFRLSSAQEYWFLKYILKKSMNFLSVCCNVSLFISNFINLDHLSLLVNLAKDVSMFLNLFHWFFVFLISALILVVSLSLLSSSQFWFWSLPICLFELLTGPVFQDLPMRH